MITGEQIVRMLKKIIYSGQDNRDKFVLTGFPDVIDHAKEFEAACGTITAIIYCTASETVVEIKNNNMATFNIDALFKKQFRLKTMSNWDHRTFQEHLGQKIDWGVVQALISQATRPLSRRGKPRPRAR